MYLAQVVEEEEGLKRKMGLIYRIRRLHPIVFGCETDVTASLGSEVKLERRRDRRMRTQP